MADFGIGVDLGGTNLRAAAVSAEGTILDQFQISTPRGEGRDKIVTGMVEGINKVREGRGDASLAGIGVGVPGLIELKKGLIHKAPNLPGWENFPLRDELESKLGCPVLLENDANAAALGEYWLGAGHDVNDLVLVTLGTGIGGGIVSGEKILHGYLGMAGEIGHVTVEPNSGMLCGCGNYGCLEVQASATAVARMGNDVVHAQRSDLLAELIEKNGGRMTAQLVHEAALAGDEEAKRVYVRMGVALGRGMATLIDIFNFPLYLLAGGVLAAWDLFAPAMFDEIEHRSVTFRETDTRVEKAKLGNQAGLYGAAFLPIQHKRRQA